MKLRYTLIAALLCSCSEPVRVPTEVELPLPAEHDLKDDTIAFVAPEYNSMYIETIPYIEDAPVSDYRLVGYNWVFTRYGNGSAPVYVKVK